MATLLGSTIGGHYYGSDNGSNILIRTINAGSGAGILLQNSAGAFKAQIYGEGSDYGFLSTAWGSWDIRKTVSGNLYLNNSTAYYLNTTGTSLLNRVLTAGRLEVTYNDDRYQMNFLRSSGTNWWVTNDSDKLGLHLNNVGDRFYFSTNGDFWSSNNGWLSTALDGRLYQASQANLDVNAFNATGLYRGSTNVWSNRPTVQHNGGALLQIDTHPGNYHSQLFFDTGADRLYFRNANAGTWGSWLTMIHSGNIGSQSVSYATTAGALTSMNISQFTNNSGYIAAGSTVSEAASQSNATRFRSAGDISQGGGNHALQIFADTNNDAFMAFHISGDYAVHFGLDDSTNRMYVGGWSDGTGTKYQIWDSRDFSSTNISNWNTAYGWGNHAGLYQPLENQRLSTGNNVTFNQVYTNNWFRNNAINTGLYQEAGGGNHWYAEDSNIWTIGANGSYPQIRFRSGGHQGTIRGYVYADTSNNIGFLNNSGSWSLRTDASRNTVLFGQLTVGQDVGYSSIYMYDSDEGTREIHCNSNRIGFLTQAGSWGAYLDDSTNWYAVGSMQAPIFYDSNDTTYYLDPNSTTALRTVGSWRSDSAAWDGEFAGKIQYHSNNWYFQALSNWFFRNSGGSNVVSIDSGGNISASGFVGNNPAQTRDKLRVWDGSSYTIGMKSGYDYGHLGTDEYAMSFQMNDNSGRGFWWGDDAHNDNQGAASLTTDGRMTIARSLSVGEGEAVVSPSSTPLYVKGSTSGADVVGVDGVNGRLFTVTDDLSGSLFSVNTIAGLPVIEAFADNTVTIGKYGYATTWSTTGFVTVPNSANIYRDLFINGGRGGDFGNRLIIGTDAATYTLQDSNQRPTAYLHGAYPVVTLNHTVTGNTSHGPTIQLTHDTNNKQWVIGSNGTGTRLDIGYSENTNRNPHNGIDDYNGSTFLRVDNGGNIQLGRGNGRTTWVNDTLYVGASDSGDSHMYFGEDSSGWYGLHWYWDSGHTVYLYGRNAGTDTEIMRYTTNSNSYVEWRRHFNMNNYEINYLNQIHFNDNVWFTDDGNNRYLIYKWGNSTEGGIKFVDGDNALQGYVYGSGTGSFGLLDGGGNWKVRVDTSDVEMYGTQYLTNVYAYILYDRSDSSYYLDPASYSRIWRTSTHLGPSPGVGSSNWVTDFNNTPVSSMSFGGDLSAGGPQGTWWFQQNMRHSNASNYWGTQIAWGWEDNANELWQRNVTGGSWGSWVRYINTNNYAGILDARYYTETEVNNLLSSYATTSSLSGYVATTYNTSLNSDSRNTRGVTRLYRRDDNSDFSVQTHWTGTYWRLEGYNGDTYHAGVSVAHAGLADSATNANYANSAGSASNADTVDGFHASVAGTANTIPTRNSSGYLIPENWIQLNGIYGLYAPTNNAHLRPNPNSYGSWLVTGGRNGWGGIEFDYGSNGPITMMIAGDSNTVGFHNNAYGWQIRWANGTLYVGKNSYGGGDVAVIDANSIGSQSVNYANYSGYSNGLSRYGIIYGNDWNTYRVNGQFIVMSAHGHSGSNRPSGAYTYGSGMSYYNAGSDHYQFYIPENSGNSNGNSQKIWYRSGWNDNWGGWRSIVDVYNSVCYIDGTVTASGDVIAYSDARVKENVHTIENALDKTLKLRGVTYNRTDVEDKSTKIGVIAQEIMEVLPEVVTEDETGMYGVSYGNLTAVLIEAIKEQQKQIEELRNELNKLKG